MVRATTRAARGLRCSMKRLIVPPLPAASRPSNKITCLPPVSEAQYWIKRSGERVVIVFEGRDAAGKGGTIKRCREHLNPRGARHVALAKPTEAERGEWYFQR